MRMAKKEIIKKTVLVNDKSTLAKQFYQSYNPNYWLYKITSLKNLHDNYDEIKKIMIMNLGEEKLDDEEYKKMLRTEMHFLYFKIVESLFEIIFALSNHTSTELWIALTCSNIDKTNYYSDCYNKIKDFSNSIKRKVFLSRMVIIENIEIPILDWLFHYIDKTAMTKKQMIETHENIEKILSIFAKDFSDRDQYNAYKHSLRIWNQPFSMAIQFDGSDKILGIMNSKDAITYLGIDWKRYYDKKSQEFKIYKVNKTFNFENDYRKCCLAYELLRMLILTRKHKVLDELKNKIPDFKFPILYNFDIDIYPDSEEFSITA